MILLFLDCETTGLDPVIHVPWEVAAVRAEHTDTQLRVLGTYEARISLSPIQHAVAHPIALQVGRFHERHRIRANGNERPVNIGRVAHEIDKLCDDKPHLVGAVPSFDERRIGDLMRRCGTEPRWHYHLIDVETLVLGALVALEMTNPDKFEVPAMPWKSDDLSRAIGVNPDDYDRHTAMGDVRWAMAQYAAVFGLEITQ